MTITNDRATIAELGLVNPDRPNPEPEITDDEKLARRLLGSLLCDSELFTQAQPIIKPHYWFYNSHRYIYQRACNYVNRYGGLPSRKALVDDVADSMRPDDLNRKYFMSQVDACHNAYEPGMVGRSELLDRVVTFARLQGYKTAVSQTTDDWRRASRTGEPVDGDAILERFRKVVELTNLSTTDDWLDVLADDFCDGENVRWLIDNFIASGQLMVLAARSKAGKSILMCELIARLLGGKPFLGGACREPSTPILYCDWENQRTYFRHWFDKLRGSTNRCHLSKYLNYKTRSLRPDGRGSLPDYLTRSWLQRQTEAVEKHRGYERPGLVVIDTFRAATFTTPGLDANYENSAGAVGSLLRPIQELAHQTGWAVLVLHHLNKSNDVSGSTDFWASADSVCTMQRDVDTGSNESVFTFCGRYETAIPPKVLTFDDDQFVYRGTLAEWEAIKSKKLNDESCLDVSSDLVSWMKTPLLNGGKTTFTKKELIQAVKDTSGRGHHWASRMIDQLAEGKIITAEDKGNVKLYKLPGGIV